MAQLIGVPPKHVSQVINERYQCNFNTFINRYRIHEACRRINNTAHYGHYTLEAISRSVGFKARSSFIVTFKAFTGMTPSEYQRISKSKNK
ncbi:MAG: helix-turn-helix domain-containing protein [Prevotella sp.]